MKRIFIILIILLSFSTIGLLFKDPIYAESKNLLYYSPCNTPIPYSIGTIDKGFDITSDQLIADTEKAGGIWSTTQGKELFVYDPASKFTINMVYDSRQALTSKITDLNNNLKVQQGTIDPKIAQYKKDQIDFEQSVNGLNSKVQYWNSHGGAPKDEYDKLISEQKNLQAEAITLNDRATSLGQSTSQYNMAAQELNQTIGDYQSVLQNKPEEGLYEQDGTTRKISIYIDIEQDEFLHTLTHEMGHALGLEHNSDPKSIMYPSTNNILVPSSQDISALNDICKSRSIIEVALTRLEDIASVLRSRLNKN